MRSFFFVVFSIALLQGCKVDISVPEGGQVTSSSGIYTCGENLVCSIDVDDLSFNETFIADAGPGYTFVGWQQASGHLCGDSQDPCTVNVSPLSLLPNWEALINGNITLFIAPVFELREDAVQLTRLSVDALPVTSFSIAYSYALDDDQNFEQFELTDSAGRELDFEVAVEGDEIHIAPSPALQYQKDYTLSLPAILAAGGLGQADAEVLHLETVERSEGFFLGSVFLDQITNVLWGGEGDDRFLIDTLTQNGMSSFRLGQTLVEDPDFENSDPYQWSMQAGGWHNPIWSSRALNSHIFDLQGNENRGNRSVFLFFSYTATHIFKYDTLADWNELDDQSRLQVVEDHARESARFYRDRGIVVDQFEIGNETDWGIAGRDLTDKGGLPASLLEEWNQDIVSKVYGGELELALPWLKEHLWSNHVDVVKAAVRGIRSVLPDVKIAVHNVGFFQPDNYTLEFYKYLIERAGSDFDVIGLSYPYMIAEGLEEFYDAKPFFTGNDFHNLIQGLSKLGKEIQISEYSYPHQPDGVAIEPSNDYPVTPDGQARFLEGFIHQLASYPAVTGAYYFYPDYFRGKCNCSLDGLGLFEDPFTPLPALSVMRDLHEQYNSSP